MMDGIPKILNKPFCYYIPQIPNGADCGGKPDHFFCAIVVPDEPGYYATDWDWGTDRETAEACAEEMNRKLGLTEEQAAIMVLRSMGLGRVADDNSPNRLGRKLKRMMTN